MNEQKPPVWFKNPIQWLMATGHGNLVLFFTILTALVVNALWNPIPHDTWEAYLYTAGIFVIVIIGFSLNYGSPKNWWQPFFGHDIVIDPDPTIARNNPKGDNGYGLVAFDKEIADWLTESGIKRVIKINHKRYRFLYKRDAARFKMAWWRV